MYAICMAVCCCSGYLPIVPIDANDHLLDGEKGSSDSVTGSSLASPNIRSHPVNDAFTTVTRNSVGRLGLDSSTLRLCSGRAEASVSIYLSWSDDTERSTACETVSSHLLLRLHNWLRELDFGVVGAMRN